MAAWRWPWLLAIGVLLQFVAERGGPAHRVGTAPPPDAVLTLSHFVAGALVFALLASVLLYGAHRARVAWRRANRRRRRAAGRRLS